MPLPLILGAAMGVAKGVGALKKVGVFKGIAKVASKTKAVSKVAKLTPLGKATSSALAIGGAYKAGQAMVSRPFGAPAGFAPSKLPALRGVPTPAAMPKQGGILPFWRGPNNALQMPWSDPKVPEYLKQFALDDAYLKTYYRAPKGYVVLRDASGRPFAVMKQMARMMGLWKPKRKPPISVRDWRAYQRAEVVEKKLSRIARRAMRHHPRRASSTVPTRRRSK